jgi:hypothetical protein
VRLTYCRQLVDSLYSLSLLEWAYIAINEEGLLIRSTEVSCLNYDSKDLMRTVSVCAFEEKELFV